MRFIKHTLRTLFICSLLIVLGVCFSFADSPDKPLAPDLEDVKTYELAEKIAQSTQATRDVTYTTDDIYNVLTSVRIYVNSAYQLKVYDSAVLGALQDLNGYNTAYNTHSMLVDMWNRIGGNSVLGSSYNITDLLKDISDNFQPALYEGAESYYTNEMLFGMWGFKSLGDIYSKIEDVEDSTDNNTTLLGYIYNDIAGIKSIIASADVLAAKQDQQDYEDDALTNFTGSGSAAASRSDQGNIKDTSRALKSGLNSGGSVSNSLGVFNTTNNSLWDWFTRDVANSLDTTIAGEEIFSQTISVNSNMNSISINGGRGTYTLICEFNSNTTYDVYVRYYNGGAWSNWDTIPSGTDSTTLVYQNIYANSFQFYSPITQPNMYLTIYKESQTRNSGNQIVDFINPNWEEIQRGLGDGESGSERR